MPHPLNRRTVAWLVAVVLTTFGFATLAAFADQADAHHRDRSQRVSGQPPSEQVLSCIRQYETGGGVAGQADYSDPGSRWNQAERTYAGYATAYQMDDDFARAYSAAIPDEHWALWGSSRNDPPWLWHYMIQDETARNGYRARGLQPWPTPNRLCRG